MKASYVSIFKPTDIATYSDALTENTAKYLPVSFPASCAHDKIVSTFFASNMDVALSYMILESNPKVSDRVLIPEYIAVAVDALSGVCSLTLKV